MARRSYQLAIGELVGKSFGIYFRNLLPFLVISAATLSPWVALTLFVEDYTETLLFDGGGSAPKLIALGILTFVVQTVLGFVMTGAITFGTVQSLRNQPAAFGETVRMGMTALGRVFWTAMLVGLRILLYSSGALAMILVAMLAGEPMLAAIAWPLMIPGLIEWVRLYVAVPASVMEGKAAGESVARSKWLTDGSRWQVFGAWFLVALLAWVVALVIGAVVVWTEAFDPTNSWLNICIQVLVTPFGATMAATTYFLLRMGKENVDAKELAAVFD